MRVISNEKISCFDVDETLIEKVHSTDGTLPFDLELDYYGEIGRYKTLKRNIQQIKSHLQRGWFVIIWSHSGPIWAEQVIRALEIDDKNLLIMNKPLKYFDDLPAAEWMGERVFLKD